MSLSDLWTSFVRTAVPTIVGALLATRIGPFIDVEAATAALTAGFAIIYYAIVRVLEMVGGPAFGWFLGLARQPVYIELPDTGDIAAVPEWDQADADGEPL